MNKTIRRTTQHENGGSLPEIGANAFYSSIILFVWFIAAHGVKRKRRYSCCNGSCDGCNSIDYLLRADEEMSIVSRDDSEFQHDSKILCAHTCVRRDSTPHASMLHSPAGTLCTVEREKERHKRERFK